MSKLQKTIPTPTKKIILAKTGIQFDFYLKITEDILRKALNYAKRYVAISDDETELILDTKQSILFTNKQVWVKKGRKAFDVTMGSWDGAEVADLVGLYLLSQLQDLNLNIGLYRDDGLAVCSLPPRQAELTKKKLCRIFKENGFNITADANMKSVNFLDVNFNLETELFRPYMKPNSTPNYVHKNSNHPRSIIENIPKSINRRLSAISSNKEVFDAACPPYQAALERSGYDYKLNFEPPTPQPPKRRNRPRKITWFNPPFSQNVQTNIGGKFLGLIKKHFPKGSPLYKVVNPNTIKVSYRCMSNFKQKIAAHNSRVKANTEAEQLSPACNCTGEMGPCPMGGNCLIKSVVYGAQVVDSQGQIETYTGLTSISFKERYYGHRISFKKEDSESSTTLSTHIWGLK